MEKGKKKYLLVALLLLLVGAGALITYSIYHTSISGNGSIRTAKWNVQFTKKDTTQIQNEFTFDYDDITWNTNHAGQNKTIAPGDTGTITFEIDATGSEVPVDWTAAVDTLSNAPANGFTATLNETEGHMGYNASSMKKQLTLTVTWVGDASAPYDNADQNKTVTIPVTLTAQQCTNVGSTGHAATA